MLALYVDLSLDYSRSGDAMREPFHVVRQHGLRVPGPLVQFFKTLAMCEGILQAIDPESSFADYLQPTAACIVALSVVMLFYRPRGWEGWIGAVFWIAVGAAIMDFVRTLLTLRK